MENVPTKAVEPPTHAFVDLPFQDAELWATLCSQLLDRNIQSFEELKDRLLQIHPKQSFSFFTQYLPKADSYPNNGGVTQKEFLDEILPYVLKTIKRMPEIFPNPLPLLRRREVGVIVFTQEQAACLVATGMFQLFACKGGRRFGGTRPAQNFGALCETTQSNPPNLVLMIMIMHYFLRLARNPPSPGRNIYVSRAGIRAGEMDIQWWENCQASLSDVSIRAGRIEDDNDALFHADFANEYLGGGVMNGALAQEEILFCAKPECLAAMSVVEVMKAEEAITITGAERFSDYSGYGHGLKLAETSPADETPILEKMNTLRRHIVAIDAIVNFNDSQYETPIVLRDLNKLYAGLYRWRQVEAPFDPVVEDATSPQDAKREAFATGHWGCGAFGGNKELKAIQQWMSISAAGLDTHYFPFGDAKFTMRFQNVIDTIKGTKIQLKVADLAKILFRAVVDAPGKIFEFVLQQVQDPAASWNQTPAESSLPSE